MQLAYVALVTNLISTFQSVASPSLPFFLLGFGSLLAAGLSVNLPETANAALSNTLEEAEEFGKDQWFFYLPMIEQYGLRRRAGATPAGAREQMRRDVTGGSTTTVDTSI